MAGMDFATLVRAVTEHSDALRAAAVAAGPDAAVPSCPKWNVQKLVRHIGRVQSWVVAAIADPTGESARAGTAPDGWEAVLAWWDEQRAALREAFASRPDAPAWLPFASYRPTVGSWARRQAHEAAIHRVDAELARGGGTVTFDAAFAADGIDELLMLVAHRSADWSEGTADGTVLVCAEDIGRMWSVRLTPGQAPRLADHPEPGVRPGATIEGCADAVYRAVWGRPNAATITGDAGLLEVRAAP
jgi:uncharacterized protein (TIGR03083 family)